MPNKNKSNLIVKKNTVYSGKKENHFKDIIIRDFNQQHLNFKEKKKEIIKQLENSKNSMVSSSIKKVKTCTTEEAILFALSDIPQYEWDLIYNIISSPLLKDKKEKSKFVSIVTVPMQS